MTQTSLDKPQVVFVLGGPGSGKGTQCNNLVKEFGCVHLSVGELLRKERNNKSEVGKLIDKYIKHGNLVPTSISLELTKSAINEPVIWSLFI